VLGRPSISSQSADRSGQPESGAHSITRIMAVSQFIFVAFGRGMLDRANELDARLRAAEQCAGGEWVVPD
jgi:hypothetical protein